GAAEPGVNRKAAVADAGVVAAGLQDVALNAGAERSAGTLVLHEDQASADARRVAVVEGGEVLEPGGFRDAALEGGDDAAGVVQGRGAAAEVAVAGDVPAVRTAVVKDARAARHVHPADDHAVV